jgi:hypothetical protein
LRWLFYGRLKWGQLPLINIIWASVFSILCKHNLIQGVGVDRNDSLTGLVHELQSLTIKNQKDTSFFDYETHGDNAAFIIWLTPGLSSALDEQLNLQLLWIEHGYWMGRAGSGIALDERGNGNNLSTDIPLLRQHYARS